MQAKDFQSFLPECCTEVFDSMYFVSVFGVIAPLENDDLEPAEAASGTDNLAFTLNYSGDIAGDFGVSLGVDAARTLAANFLGSDESELSSEEISEVVGELANMLCGAVMSCVAGEHTFVLSHPQAHDPLGIPKTGDVLSTLFETEIGPVCVWVTVEGAVCSR